MSNFTVFVELLCGSLQSAVLLPLRDPPFLLCGPSNGRKRDSVDCQNAWESTVIRPSYSKVRVPFCYFPNTIYSPIFCGPSGAALVVLLLLLFLTVSTTHAVHMRKEGIRTWEFLLKILYCACTQLFSYSGCVSIHEKQSDYVFIRILSLLILVSWGSAKYHHF